MMWVRTPSGQCIRYNRAGWVIRNPNGYADIYTKEGGDWIAQVPNEWLIENEAACHVEQPTNQLSQEVVGLRKEVASLRRLIAKQRRAT